MSATRKNYLTILTLVFITCLFATLFSVISPRLVEATSDASTNIVFDGNVSELEVVGYDVFCDNIFENRISMDTNINYCKLDMTEHAVVTVENDLVNMYHGNTYYGKFVLYKLVDTEYVSVGDISSSFSIGKTTTDIQNDVTTVKCGDAIKSYIDTNVITGAENYRICFFYATQEYMSVNELEYVMSGDYVDFTIRILNRYALPTAPEREGYKFAMWYTNPELTIPYVYSYVYEDTNLYAKYTIKQFSIKLNYDASSRFLTVDYGNSIEFPTIKKTGWVVEGWYYEDGTRYNGEPVKSDLVLTAKWGVQYVTVNFFIDNELYKTTSVPYGTLFSAVIDELNLNVYNLSNVNSGVENQKDELVIVGDTDVQLAEPNFFQRSVEWVKDSAGAVWEFTSAHWIEVLSVAVALASLTTMIIVLIKKRG